VIIARSTMFRKLSDITKKGALVVEPLVDLFFCRLNYKPFLVRSPKGMFEKLRLRQKVDFLTKLRFVFKNSVLNNTS
jgi:hypothetical protein